MAMAVAPLIAMKSTACDSLEAVGKELDRRAHTYVNDVHPERAARDNVYYFLQGATRDTGPMPLEMAIDKRMAELNTRRAIRKDAVKAMGFIVTTNDALEADRAHEFLEDAANWFAARYGEENVLAASEHYDEGTPHLHLWLAPVIHEEDGHDRLCAKELFAPDKRRKDADGKWEVTAEGTMSQLQSDFYRQVARKYGFERPLDHTKRAKGYRSLEAYKCHVGVTRELKSETLSLARERDEAAKEAARAKAEKQTQEAARAKAEKQTQEAGAVRDGVLRLASEASRKAQEALQRAEEAHAAQMAAEEAQRAAEEAQRAAERAAAEAEARLEGVQGRLADAEAEKSRLERRVEVFEAAVSNLRARLTAWLWGGEAAVRQALGLAPVPEAQRRGYAVAEEETRTVGMAWDGGIGHNEPQLERQGGSLEWHR